MFRKRHSDRFFFHFVLSPFLHLSKVFLSTKTLILIASFLHYREIYLLEQHDDDSKRAYCVGLRGYVDNIAAIQLNTMSINKSVLLKSGRFSSSSHFWVITSVIFWAMQKCYHSDRILKFYLRLIDFTRVKPKHGKKLIHDIR